MHMLAIGAAEEIMLVELDADPQEESQEVHHQEIPGDGEPEADHLLECLDHQPATFVKGKPRSIISLPILLMSPKLLVLLHYVIGVVWKHLLHITFPCPKISTLNPIKVQERSLCLAMLRPVEVG